MTTRRDFLKSVGIGAAAAATLPIVPHKALSAPAHKPKDPIHKKECRHVTIKGYSPDALSEIDIKQMMGRDGQPVYGKPSDVTLAGGYYYTSDWGGSSSWKYNTDASIDSFNSSIDRLNSETQLASKNMKNFSHAVEVLKI